MRQLDFVGDLFGSGAYFFLCVILNESMILQRHAQKGVSVAQDLFPLVF